MINFLSLSASITTILAILGASCGSGEDERVMSSASSVLSSSSASTESVSMSLSDALEALSDSNPSGGSSSSLFLQETNPMSISKERSCEVSDDQAVVTVSTSIEGERSFETSLGAQITRTISGAGTHVRTWSRQDSSIACNNPSTAAAIDWTSDGISGLSLAVTVERSKTATISRIKNDTEISRSKSFTTTGTRQVQWTSHTDNDDGTFTRVKTVSSSMARNSSGTTREGEEINLSLTVESLDGQDLSITVVRNSTDLSLVSKEISSGALKSFSDENAYVVTSFENYLINFDSESCAPVSGSVLSKFYEEGTEEPVKTLQLSVVNGEYSLEDITDSENPTAITDFDYDLCYSENF